MADLILLGDIGGTNSRFALAYRGEVVPRGERHYENALFPTFADAIRAYLDESGAAPVAAVVAIAGPVAGDIVGPTNLQAWHFAPPALAREFGLGRLAVINDFEAVAYSLPHLPDDATRAIGPLRTGELRGNMAVLGPGTGLGVGALVHAGSRWIAVASEGGHAEIAPPSPPWWPAHRLIHGALGRVSGEHVLSGPGLERIDAALAELAGHPRRRTAPEVGAAALAGGDPVASEAAQLFFDYLARFSGDVALMFGTTGGLFLYGGVAQKLAPLLDPARFRTAFEAKQPLDGYLAAIPTRLITHPTPGLIGCAVVADHG